MLSLANRLSRNDFRPLFHHGKRVTTADMELIYAPKKMVYPRFAIIVTAKISKLATHRNRSRRLVAEAIRSQLPGKLGGFDGVVVVRRDFYRENIQSITAAMQNILDKIRTQREKQ